MHVQEIRSVWLSLEATLQIPKARRTAFDNRTFLCLSYGRYCLLLCSFAARAAIAAVLLVAGTLWLARTTSIEELMLNAVALHAILDVDEFLFACLTPIKMQHVIQSLEPIQVKYSRRRSQCETIAHFSLILTAVLLAYYILIAPLQSTMLEVKIELCGGNQSFVVSYNRDTQVTHGLVTASAKTRDDGQYSVSELAVMKHIGISAEAAPGYIPDSYLATGNIFHSLLGSWTFWKLLWSPQGLSYVPSLGARRVLRGSRICFSVPPKWGQVGSPHSRFSFLFVRKDRAKTTQNSPTKPDNIDRSVS